MHNQPYLSPYNTHFVSLIDHSCVFLQQQLNCRSMAAPSRPTQWCPHILCAQSHTCTNGQAVQGMHSLMHMLLPHHTRQAANHPPCNAAPTHLVSATGVCPNLQQLLHPAWSKISALHAARSSCTTVRAWTDAMSDGDMCMASEEGAAAVLHRVPSSFTPHPAGLLCWDQALPALVQPICLLFIQTFVGSGALESRGDVSCSMAINGRQAGS